MFSSLRGLVTATEGGGVRGVRKVVAQPAVGPTSQDGGGGGWDTAGDLT